MGLKIWVNKVATEFVTWLGTVKWRTHHVLATEDHVQIKQLLEKDYYIVLTMHRGFLSSYAVWLAHLVLTLKPGYYAHSLMNVEDEVKGDDDFRFIEATRVGVHYSGYDHAIDDQMTAIALLKPKHMTLEDWTTALDRAKTELGKPYDTLYDLASDQELSCVELVRAALQYIPDYDKKFANFEAMIAKYKNLDPHMFYECEDFEVVCEIRR